MIIEDQNTMALFIVLEEHLTFDKIHEYLKLLQVKRIVETSSKVECWFMCLQQDQLV